jgi:hypothetical protein
VALGPTQPPLGRGTLSSGIKRPGRELEHSRLGSALVNVWIFAISYAFMILHRDGLSIDTHSFHCTSYDVQN